MFENLKKYLTPAESIDADEAKKFIAEHTEGDYTLLDVRQPGEYEASHIPGAKLIPIAQLPDRLDEIDPEKPVIAYCAVGGRSRVAAQMLSGRGFRKVCNLTGGIKGWNGLTADGPVELNMDIVRGDETPTEVIRLAYGMEHNLATFYRKIRDRIPNGELAQLLGKLASIEDKHKQSLFELYNTMEPFPVDRQAFESDVSVTFLEGGFNPEEFTKNNEKFLGAEDTVLDLAMMLEAQAMDLYMRFADRLEKQGAKDILYKISQEEKSHLEALGKLREKAA
jgi:rhodanese-related sulfurtransferase/rubrerythrin